MQCLTLLLWQHSFIVCFDYSAALAAARPPRPTQLSFRRLAGWLLLLLGGAPKTWAWKLRFPSGHPAHLFEAELWPDCTSFKVQTILILKNYRWLHTFFIQIFSVIFTLLTAAQMILWMSRFSSKIWMNCCWIGNVSKPQQCQIVLCEVTLLFIGQRASSY